MRLAAFLVLALAVPVTAQVPGVIAGGGPGPDLATATIRVERSLAQPSLGGLSVLTDIAGLRSVSTAPPEAKVRADALLADASARLPMEDVAGIHQRAAEATALLLGREWTPDTAYAASLALDVTELIADPAAPIHVRLTQLYPLPSKTGLTLRLSLTTLGNPGRGAVRPEPEREIRQLWTMPLPERDLVARNLPFEVDLAGVPDGNYVLSATVTRGDAAVGITRTPIRLANGLLSAERAVRAKLGTAKGDRAATIAYPFDTVRAVVGWRRDIPDNLDLKAAVARSAAMLATADDRPAPGDHYRAYVFGVAGESMPYRVYVPKAWKPGVKLPLVVALHGGGLNEDSVFPGSGRFAGMMQRLAEQHGMIVVSPLGFRPNGGYGVVYGPTSAGRGGVRPEVASEQTIPTLSEADTLAVITRVAQQYGTDADRTYLVGNSMGGGGTWYIGAKYASMFAAIAPCASSMPFDRFDFDRLAKVPVRIVVGELDAEVRRGLAHKAAETLTARHYDASLTIVPHENHSDAWLVALPDTFAFFAAQKRNR